jgi:hypothetical protein
MRFNKCSIRGGQYWFQNIHSAKHDSFPYIELYTPISRMNTLFQKRQSHVKCGLNRSLSRASPNLFNPLNNAITHLLHTCHAQNAGKKNMAHRSSHSLAMKPIPYQPPHPSTAENSAHLTGTQNRPYKSPLAKLGMVWIKAPNMAPLI